MLGRATDLTRAGKLLDATAAIQRALGDTQPSRTRKPVRGEDSRQPLDGDFRVVAPTQARASQSRRKSAPAGDASGGFSAGTYAAQSGTRHYKLFVPAGLGDKRLPLLVMLHGCKQDPDDFAAGTRMNLLAQELGVIVLYPAQAPRSNAYKCWNWFQPGDQRRGAGEPALLAAMTRHIMETQAVDADRVYIAGLSAGGAMAAIMGREYADLYAAVGVHSGLAPGAAHDVSSAFSVMNNGAPGKTPRGAASIAGSRTAPIIVFHGDRDSTVHADNGAHVVGARAAASARHDKGDAAGRTYTRSRFKPADGHAPAEHWVIHGAGHAWSGGSSDGSYTDAQGPDASREMLRFFLEHPHRSRA